MLAKIRSQVYFNSRPHEEVDGSLGVKSVQLAAFQLTTSRRGRHKLMEFYIHHLDFNSRPHEEVDGVLA